MPIRGMERERRMKWIEWLTHTLQYIQIAMAKSVLIKVPDTQNWFDKYLSQNAHTQTNCRLW